MRGDDAARAVRGGGTAAAVELLVSATFTPPVGAGPLRVIVAVDVPPAVTAVGLNATPERTGGATVSTAVAELAALAALIVADTLAAVGVVVIVNVLLELPAAIVTLAAGAAAVELLVLVTLNPPEGAGPLSVTVPVLDEPPVTLVGARARLLMASGTAVITVSEYGATVTV